MQIRTSTVVIPCIAAAIALLGGYFTMLGMDGWYAELNQPPWAPPDWVFGPVWTLIYALTALAAVLTWNNFSRGKIFTFIFILLCINAASNVIWSYLFFTLHEISFALVDALIIEGTIIAATGLIALRAWRYALLLVPYICWVAFAIYLNYAIVLLN